MRVMRIIKPVKSKSSNKICINRDCKNHGHVSYTLDGKEVFQLILDWLKYVKKRETHKVL